MTDYPDWNDDLADDRDVLDDALAVIDDLLERMPPTAGRYLDVSGIYQMIDRLDDWRQGWPEQRVSALQLEGTHSCDECYELNTVGGCGAHEAPADELARYGYLDRLDARFIGVSDPDWLHDVNGDTPSATWPDEYKRFVEQWRARLGRHVYGFAVYDPQPPLWTPLGWDADSHRFVALPEVDLDEGDTADEQLALPLLAAVSDEDAP